MIEFLLDIVCVACERESYGGWWCVFVGIRQEGGIRLSNRYDTKVCLCVYFVCICVLLYKRLV
jgi:hypothetical protein